MSKLSQLEQLLDDPPSLIGKSPLETLKGLLGSPSDVPTLYVNPEPEGFFVFGNERLRERKAAMPSGDNNLIWDPQNKGIVYHWWDRYTPQELQGIVNLRQWLLDREALATLGGVLYWGVHFKKITKEEAKKIRGKANYQRSKELTKAKEGKGFVYPMLGTNPKTGKPVAEEIGDIALTTIPETGNVELVYRFFDREDPHVEAIPT